MSNPRKFSESRNDADRPELLSKDKSGQSLSESTRQSKVQTVEVTADYSPDTERMLQALMLVLDLDDVLPVAEHEDAVYVSDSVS